MNESDELQRVVLVEQISLAPSLLLAVDKVKGKVVNSGNLPEVSHVVFLKNGEF